MTEFKKIYYHFAITSKNWISSICRLVQQDDKHDMTKNKKIPLALCNQVQQLNIKPIAWKIGYNREADKTNCTMKF